jgi:hypothetical protein
MKRVQLTLTARTGCFAVALFRTTTGPTFQDAHPTSKTAYVKKTISAT